VKRAVATIDLDAIAHNITGLRAAAAGSRFMAVVKADGYGHGMVPVARTAREAGAEHLGVALPVEAAALRAAGDTGDVLCWLYPPQEDLSEVVSLGVEVSAASPGMLDQIEAAATRAGRRALVHLKLDTGLGRNGAQPGQWESLVLSALQRQSRGRIEVVGVWSHLACSDEPGHPANAEQVHVFAAGLREAGALGLHPRLRHLAATGGVLAVPGCGYDMVRCGIGIYGLSPGPALGPAASLGLRPAMSVSARLALVKRVPADHGVSYGMRYRTAQSSWLGLIPVGYADGVPRSGSGRLPVQIGGRRYCVAGTVAMDQVVVDLGDVEASAGDEVLLFGGGGRGEPTADDWAQACGTINYEIVTRLGARIPRRYLGGAR
jgi:alanine racemase